MKGYISNLLKFFGNSWHWFYPVSKRLTKMIWFRSSIRIHSDGFQKKNIKNIKIKTISLENFLSHTFDQSRITEKSWSNQWNKWHVWLYNKFQFDQNFKTRRCADRKLTVQCRVNIACNRWCWRRIVPNFWTTHIAYNWYSISWVRWPGSFYGCDL